MQQIAETRIDKADSRFLLVFVVHGYPRRREAQPLSLSITNHTHDFAGKIKHATQCTTYLATGAAITVLEVRQGRCTDATTRFWASIVDCMIYTDETYTTI
jgi:hypothetical protein